MKNAVVTYVFEKAKPFINDFIDSINTQFNKDFELIIFNDGALNIESSFKKLKIKYEIINMKASNPCAVRNSSIQFLRSINDLQKIIFQDIDDKMSMNRVEVLLSKLDYYSIVCNDLTLFNAQGILSENIWNTKLGMNFIFNYEEIKQHNILGLGNTAITKNVLNTDFYHNDEVDAYDWFLFYQWMKQLKVNALFTSECQTLYRQHNENSAGISYAITQERINYVCRVITTHYKSLINIG
ncbi:MAG: hypothetical protein IT237_03790, partial [Bacteroidia bacterium]|nr:hypothetical protein [Bacteroidia bacterium]